MQQSEEKSIQLQSPFLGDDIYGLPTQFET